MLFSYFMTFFWLITLIFSIILSLSNWIFSVWGNLFIYFLLLFNYSCSHFSPSPSPCPTHPDLQPSILPAFVFFHGSFIHVPCWPFLYFPPLSLLGPSGPCQFVLYFNVSGYILLACLFCWLGSTCRCCLLYTSDAADERK